jgi:hypothetical protein
MGSETRSSRRPSRHLHLAQVQVSIPEGAAVGTLHGVILILI